MVNADFALVAVLISFGAVVDLTTPLQLIVMATCEIPLFITNEHISLEILQVSAFFGVRNKKFTHYLIDVGFGCWRVNVGSRFWSVFRIDGQLRDAN